MHSPTTRLTPGTRTLLGGFLVVLLALATAGCGGASPAPAASTPAAPAATSSESAGSGAAGTEAAIPSPEQAPSLDPAQRDAAFTQALASKNL